MSKPLPIIKFITSNTPVYIDMREVEGIGSECPGKISVLFKSGRTFQLDLSFEKDLEKCMDMYARGDFGGAS